MIKTLLRLGRFFLNDQRPLTHLLTRLLGLSGLLRYDICVQIEAVDRPNYGYCVYNAALLAKKLGYQRMSVLEFGVAGGNGLLNLEYHAQQINKLLSIDIEIYGFDTGEGLPKPLDYRDVPYYFCEGFYKMDVPKLQDKLKKAKLVLGNVRDKIKSFIEEYNPAPIGAIMVDLDFYSSTKSALEIFDVEEKYLLPRIFCYFDDVLGTETELYNDHTGERLAIREFNQSHERKKLEIAYHLVSKNITSPWYYCIYIYHDFEHTRYNDYISTANNQLPLLR